MKQMKRYRISWTTDDGCLTLTYQHLTKELNAIFLRPGMDEPLQSTYRMHAENNGVIAQGIHRMVWPDEKMKCDDRCKNSDERLKIIYAAVYGMLSDWGYI
jgi:hypothetical protein